MSIQSFSDKAAETFFVKGIIKKGIGWSSISSIVKTKLDVLHYASDLKDLAAPPGNRLELLKGKMKNYHCIRINSQWRIIFKWTESGPKEVQITDYH